MKTLLLTISLATTVIPFERDISRLPEPSYLQSSTSASGNYFEDWAGDENETLFYQGFSFMNMGPNEIVTSTPQDLDYAYRNYSFVTEDHAKRDVYLWLTDYNGAGYVSDLFETIMVFLPRENQMAIEDSGEQLTVTLTTGETVIFSSKDKTILGGVMSEEPLDYNPDRAQRKFAQVKYNGKGLMIRSDVRGNDPRLVKTSKIFKGDKRPCEVRTDLFWTKENFPQFKYVSDEAAYAVIAQHCGQNFLD